MARVLLEEYRSCKIGRFTLEDPPKGQRHALRTDPRDLQSLSNNQMRDVFVSEVETSDPEAVARTYCRGKDVTMDRTDNEDGSIIFDVVADGLHQRLSFTPDD